MDNYNKKQDLVKQLQVCWTNEKFSKDLNKYNTELIQSVLMTIEKRVKLVIITRLGRRIK